MALYLAEGHFGLQITEVGDRTTNVLVDEPQYLLSHRQMGPVDHLSPEDSSCGATECLCKM